MDLFQIGFIVILIVGFSALFHHYISAWINKRTYYVYFVYYSYLDPNSTYRAEGRCDITLNYKIETNKHLRSVENDIREFHLKENYAKHVNLEGPLMQNYILMRKERKWF